LRSAIDRWAGVDGMSTDDVKVELFSDSDVKNSHQVLVRLKKTQATGQFEQVVEKVVDFDRDQTVIEALTALNVGGKANDLRFFKESIEPKSAPEIELMDSVSDDF